MYETPPNSSLFGDQWHFMMRALNFNAASPSSGTFSATHLLVLTYLLTSTYSILSTVSAIKNWYNFLLFMVKDKKIQANLWELRDTLEFSLEPVILWEEIGSRKSAQPILLLFL